MNAIPAELPEAMKLHAAGNTEQAEALYRTLLAANPDHPEVLHLLATACFQHRNYAEAREHIEKAIQKDRRNLKHYQRLVDISKAEGHNERTIAALEKMAVMEPTNAKTLQDFLNLSLNSKIFDPIIGHLGKLIARTPHDLTLRNLILLALTEAERFEEALPHYAFVFAHHPNQQVSFCKSYGHALHRAGKFAEAQRLTEQWIQAFPNDTDMLILKASTHAACGEHEATVATLHRMLALEPERANFHQSLALKHFLLSDMKEGYDEYLWRHTLEKAIPFDFPLPEWKGEPLNGKRLVIWAEQGIGDIVMFLSLLPWVLEQGANVTLAVFPKLIPLLQRTFPACELVELNKRIINGSEEHWDYHMAMGELMRYVLPHYAPSKHPPFLKPDVEQSGKLREAYLARAAERGAKRIIGISWHTSNDDSAYLRNIPLEQWQPLFDLPELQFVSLQYGDHDQGIAAVNRRSPGALYRDPEIDAYEDTDGLAAQILAMDEVITIQNATAHLGGAIGVPTTLLLSARSDWRWGLTRSDSLWYGSVDIVRQKEALKWKPAIREVRGRLGH